MVERSLSMREVPGSIPGASKIIFILSLLMQILSFDNIDLTNFTRNATKIYNADTTKS